MRPDPDQPGPPTAPGEPPGTEGRSASKLAFALVSLLSLGLLAWPVVFGDGRPLETLRQAAMPACLLALLLLVALRHERRWAIPVGRLARVLSDIRRGEQASEALLRLGAEAPPEVARLAEQVRQLCHEVRSHKQAVRDLEAEIARRVATRTDSLQRQMSVLRQKASRDALTGLGNRGAFDQLFGAMVERARREGADLCVVMIDVDHFKELNDTLGHPAGDELLKQIGQLLRGAVRADQDEAFRYGGDEFVLVLWRTSAAAGRATADRLERLAEELARPLHLAHPPRLSCGVANLASMPAADPVDLLQAADEDLYRLKNMRRGVRAA